MSQSERTRRLGRFAVGGCVVGTILAYASLIALQVLVAPISHELPGVAWVAPAIAFGGLATGLWFGPRGLIPIPLHEKQIAP